jgi:RNA polymerase sigma-70 factor (ECF subfamily)
MTDVERLACQSSEAAVRDMDEEAFGLFYQATARPLWTYLSRVARRSQLADDLLQETYYRFLKSGRGFESDTHRRHYLFRIATNLVIDVRRRPGADLAELPGESDRRAPRTGETQEQAARRADLSNAMGRLKPRDRALLWLAYAQGSSHDEIAAITGVKPLSVKLLLFRARRRLIALLGGRP